MELTGRHSPLHKGRTRVARFGSEKNRNIFSRYCFFAPVLEGKSSLLRRIGSFRKRQAKLNELELNLSLDDRLSRDDISSDITQRKVAIISKIVKDSLPILFKKFSDYEITSYRISRAHSPDYDFEYYAELRYGKKAFVHGGVWFAFRFGFSSGMPPNDVPNVSVIFNDFGCDITVNAELQPAQRVFLKRVDSNKSLFDGLLRSHGGLWLKTYLKYEHQPRFYHWILSDLKPPGQFDGDTILASYELHRRQFDKERAYFIDCIEQNNRELKPGQIRHLREHNRRINLAIRLVI